MNKINATITDIQSVDSINIVSFEASGYLMKMMALELKEDLCIGSQVVIGAKATNISLTKHNIEMISVSNQLEVKIESIHLGELLCSIRFNVSGEVWESIITRDSALRMQLRTGESIVALIKSSELSIVEVL